MDMDIHITGHMVDTEVTGHMVDAADFHMVIIVGTGRKFFQDNNTHKYEKKNICYNIVLQE